MTPRLPAPDRRMFIRHASLWWAALLAIFAAVVGLHHALLEGLAPPGEPLVRSAAPLQAAAAALACAVFLLVAAQALRWSAAPPASPAQMTHLLLLALAAAGLRFPAMSGKGHPDDVRLYEVWAWKASVHGIHSLYDGGRRPPTPDSPEGVVVDNYPGCLYPLWLGGRAYRALSGRDDFPFPERENEALRFILRWPAVFADLLLAALIYAFARKRRSHAAALGCFALFAFNPAVWMDSAVYGQIDSLHSAFGLAALLALEAGAAASSGILLSWACFLKPQAFPLAAVAAIVVFRRFGARGLLRLAASGAAGAAFASLPFLVNGRFTLLWDNLASLAEVHPVLSMNGNNLWWLISWGRAHTVSDLQVPGALSALGLPLNYRALGLILLAALHVPIWRALWRNPQEPALTSYACLSAAVFFTVATQMHENYLFLALPLAAAAMASEPRMRASFAAFSLIFGLNMALHHPGIVAWLSPGNPDIFSGSELFPFRLGVSALCTVSVGVLYASALRNPFAPRETR